MTVKEFGLDYWTAGIIKLDLSHFVQKVRGSNMPVSNNLNATTVIPDQRSCVAYTERGTIYENTETFVYQR